MIHFEKVLLIIFRKPYIVVVAQNTINSRDFVSSWQIEDWNKPIYTMKAYTSYNIREKWIISGYMVSMIGIDFLAKIYFGYVDLFTFVDVGLKVKMH